MSYHRRVSLEETITQKLRDALAPVHLEVTNESHQHSSKKGAESHFRVVVVTPAFEGKALVARHQMVYRALSNELAGRLHALAITSRTPAEWEASPKPNESPLCAGKGA